MSSQIKLPHGTNTKPYKHKEWLDFREQILIADGYRCQQCGKGKADGVVLQVHHKRYDDDKMPWDYAPSDCYTLCKGCHASTHGHIIPKFGWHYLGDNDLEELSGTCEYCGTEIRYEYFIQHPYWEPLVVGIDCCDNLTGTNLASNHAESIKRFQSRRARFLRSPKWKQCNNGNEIRHHGIDVTIAQNQDSFCICMNAKHGKQKFSSLMDAQKAAFEAIESGKALEYLKKHGVEIKKSRDSKTHKG